MISSFLRNTASLLVSTLLFFTAFSVSGAEDPTSNPLDPDELVSLTLDFDSNSELKEKFKENYNIQVKFDESKLTYKKFNYQGSLKKKDLKLEKFENLLEMNYCPEGKTKRRSRKTKSTSLEFVFAVKNTAPKGETLIESKFINLDTNEEKPINSKIVILRGNPDLDKCKIKDLSSDSGILTPDFDPEVFYYEMNVDYYTKNVYFDFDPMMEDLKVKINRNKLNSSGEYTDILITVSNSKLKIKNTYTIKVYRKEKPQNKSKEKHKKSSKEHSNKSTNAKTKIKNKTESPRFKEHKKKDENSKVKMPSNEKPQNYDTNSKEVSKPKLQDEESSNESKSELNACNSEPTPEENTIKTENNETPNITTYITLAFLIASAGIAIYLSIKIIISKKKI